MAKINIVKSILINAPVEKVFPILNDMNEWTKWSPWLIQDPDAEVTVSDDNKYYSWEGKRVGSGNMKITNEVENQSIDYDLTFLKPWKSRAKVRFETESTEGGTKVSWFMLSSLPWFMFWMKKMMIAWIGMDYERGLNMLKDYAEMGKVHSKLNFKGFSEYPGCQYIGIKRDTSMRNIGEDMSKDFDRIFDFMSDKEDLIAAEPFSIYHKWEIVKGNVSYTSGIPVTSIPDDLPEGMISGAIPITKVYILEHVGKYTHLGNAWSTLQGMMRNKEFKAIKGIHPFETYANMPGEVPDEKLIARIHFAVR